MMSLEQFCLKWNDHQNILLNNVDRLLQQDYFVDCTLAAEGQYIGAHKLVLSACSPYFEALLKIHREKHPIFILKDIKFEEVKAIMAYMYRGEVIIPYDKLAELLRAAESLQVKGLGDKTPSKGSEVNGLSPLQQKTPSRPVQPSATQARSGGSGEPRRNTQVRAEVVDLTDEPQRPARVQKPAQQRASPYGPRKYNRKLDYQTSQVIQRNTTAAHSNSPGSTAVHSAAQPVTTGLQNISVASAHVQKMPTYVSVPAQLAVSPTNSSPPVNKQPIVQHVTSLAPGYQKGGSPSQGVIHFSSPPATATVTQKTLGQNVQVMRKTAPVAALQMQSRSSPLQQTSGGDVNSPPGPQAQVQPSQIHTIVVQQVQVQSSQIQTIPVQQAQVQPSQIQTAPVQQAQVQPSQIQTIPVSQAQVQPSQIQTIPVQQAQVLPSQTIQVQSPEEHSSLQTESVQDYSPLDETSQLQGLKQQNVTVSETPESLSESLNENLSSQDNSMIVSTEEDSSMLESSNISAQVGEENSNDALNISDDKSTDEVPNNESKPVKAKRGRPPMSWRPAVDRPFKCPECGKLFSQKCNMEKHRRIHSEECFNCDICDKSFVGRSTLIRHLRQHKAKNNHKCQICGMTFTSPKTLEEHLTLHAGTSTSDQ